MRAIAHGSKLTAQSIKKEKMKKIILAISLFAAVSANAQSDGFFTYNNIEEYRTESGWEAMPSLPSSHNLYSDFDAPVGNGIAILAILGLAYCCKKKSR